MFAQIEPWSLEIDFDLKIKIYTCQNLHPAQNSYSYNSFICLFFKKGKEK